MEDVVRCAPADIGRIEDRAVAEQHGSRAHGRTGCGVVQRGPLPRVLTCCHSAWCGSSEACSDCRMSARTRIVQRGQSACVLPRGRRSQHCCIPVCSQSTVPRFRAQFVQRHVRRCVVIHSIPCEEREKKKHKCREDKTKCVRKRIHRIECAGFDVTVCNAGVWCCVRCCENSTFVVKWNKERKKKGNKE